jgi:hypothetical protein
MNASRRQFVLTGITPALAAQRNAGKASDVARVLCVAPAGRANDMAGVFQELGLAADVIALDRIRVAAPEKYQLLWIVGPEYPQSVELSKSALATIQQFLDAGRGVFAEYVTNFPRVHTRDRVEKTGIARLVVAAELEVPQALPKGTILDEHDSFCLTLPTTPADMREVLSFGRVRGVRQVVSYPDAKDTWPGLLAGEVGNGRFAFSTTAVSEFRTRKYAPVRHWEKLLQDLVLMLLPDGTRKQVLARHIPMRAWSEPRRWALPNTTVELFVESAPGLKVSAAGSAREVRSGHYQSQWNDVRRGLMRVPVIAAGPGVARSTEIVLRIEDRQAAYSRALARNISWFERSGVLLRPDGSLGVAEWISGPDTDGNRIPFGAEQMFSPERADCVFESALAFWIYGKLMRSAKHQSIGKRMLVRIMDFQRLERGDPGHGLWNTRGRGGPAFQDDVSWGTICSLAGHRYIRERMFLERGLISARAQLNAFGPDDTKRVPQYSKGRRTTLTTRVDAHPHSGGCVLSAWLYAYGITGDAIYLNTALPMLDEMIANFPHIERYIISRTCEASRFLLPLALAAHYTGQQRYRDALRDQAEYLRERSVSCGAIREDGSNTGDRVEGGDLGLSYDAGETVSDQLYTTSFAAMNFWIAWKATGDERYLQDFYRITDYLVRIQIEDPDPVIDGGWMRGFDYSLWEYYGANADQAWSAYSMETGWQNAIIDIALGLHLTDDPFFQPRKPT